MIFTSTGFLFFFLALCSRFADNILHDQPVEFPGFPELGIWAKPGAPFVCIEPWYGYADPEQPYGDLWNKPGIRKLAAGGTFTCTHRVIVEQ
jgi:galactose mutarotase-like enzyme